MYWWRWWEFILAPVPSETWGHFLKLYEMSKEMKFKEVDNPPKYKVGDLVIAHRAVDFTPIYQIEDVIKSTYTPDELENIKECDRRRYKNCCGGGNTLRLDKNYYQYRVEGDLFDEEQIHYSGIDGINKYLGMLRESVEGYSSTISKIHELL